MKRLSRRAMALLSVSLAFAACGSGQESSQEIEAATSAALTTTTSTEAQISPQLAQLTTGKTWTGSWVKGTPESFTVSGTVTNPAGGSAEISGQGGKTSSGWSLQLTITFKDWIADGMKVNGSLATTYELKTTAPRSFVATLKGVLKVGVLPVPVDLVITVAAAQVSACGQVGSEVIARGSCP